jgi:hypothetical protein
MCRNYHISTWIAFKRNVKETYVSEVRDVKHVFRIDMVDTKMKGDRENNTR